MRVLEFIKLRNFFKCFALRFAVGNKTLFSPWFSSDKFFLKYPKFFGLYVDTLNELFSQDDCIERY